MTTTNKKILSFGELLFRIVPDSDGNFLTFNKIPIYVGGAELNVASALAQWNVPSTYLTALPDNDLSSLIIQNLIERKIDTTKIIKSGDRVGIYYLPQGTDLKNASVIYDRKHSSFACLQVNQLDWENIFKDVSHFHFSAICPALTKATASLCEEALQVASKKNICISLDLNYRAKLWQYGMSPLQIMPTLAKYCNVIMGNIWAANTMLGIDLNEAIFANRSKENFLEHARQSSFAIQQKFPQCQFVANTFRFDVDDKIEYYASLFSEQKLYNSHVFKSSNIVNKVGSGDCFMAGLLYGIYNNKNSQETIDFAAAAAFNKLFEQEDSTQNSVEKIINTVPKKTQ